MVTPVRTLWTVILVVFLLHTGLGDQSEKSQNSSNDSCSKQRKILTGPSGLFSDGGGDYPEDSHCEWLIRANRSQQHITLTFLEMETECSYDHVFVYHGDSYNSPLLGSFSGRTLPPPITIQSDAMLVLLYSDTNYVRNGFTAMYNISDCPQDCSERGQCIDNVCHCDALWSGSACDTPLCPNDCGINEHTGDCDRYLNPPRCICNKGYSGESCSLPESNQNGGSSWHLLTHDKTDLSPRAGVAGAYLSRVDRFYLFGGFTFEKLLGDLLAYDFVKNRWLKLSTQNGPSPRSGHAISTYARNFALYGGEMENGILSDELWLYNVAKEEWQLEAVFSKIRPPPLTKHSLTLVEGKWLYLFGGSLQDGSFSSSMYRINLNEGAQWEKVEPTGGKELERRIVGHSAVYHSATKSLFIYGGITVDYARFSRLSNQIHAFHIEKRYWTYLAYPKKGNHTPLERAFHTAAIVGDYLVVYGGYIHQHSHEELCYDNEIYLYHLGCHRWVNFASLNITNSTTPNPIQQGVFAHAMGVRKGHTLLIAGGYSGMTRGTFLAYVLPPVVTARGQQLSATACSRHKTKQSCLNYTTCSWCSQSNEEFCLDITEQDKCKSGTFSASSCPGLCPALKDCHSCLIWGEPSGPNAIGNTDTMDPFLQPTCSWCVQAAQCHPISDPPEKCKLHSKNSDSESELNWWGPSGTNITTVAECRVKDFRPGLTLLKYRHPVNFTQPDGLSYINQTAEDLRIQTEFSREREGLGSGINIATFLGFIHPLSAKSSLKNTSLQMLMDSSGGSGGRAIFQMSNDSTREHLEIIANRSMSASMEKSLHRPNGHPLFPIISPGYKYLVNFTMLLPAAYNETSTMKLKWNTSYPRANVIKVSHLEPYRNGSCNKHDNCLACLSDAACGWCEQTVHCVQRSVIDSHYPFCSGTDKYIITIPENCPLCSNYIYCEDCTKVHHCEWLIEEAHCGRRGRFDDAVRHPDLCPAPCHLRSNCTSCLGDPGRCAWCEETHNCFLFATYTTSFMFGRCREWVDEDRNAPSGVTTPGAQCRDCSRHSKCESCLKDLSCGWCGNTRNPIVGVCVQGDFSGPYFGECEVYVAQSHPTVLSELADWSYSSCPDVEECSLGLYSCHPNATCINTLGSYICTCNAGFKKIGESCTRTCSPQCVHGNCSESPEYICICELGWTGPDCTINCGCNNHSNCSRGVALCDECQDWTEGQFCERCRPGSFGDATETTGCKECNCNGHGNVSAGYCNSTTGVCYCLQNTEGPHCEFCKAGYYGDPRDGGHCYAECQTRGVITNVQEGLLGSQAGITEPIDCLWILTVHPTLNRTLVRDSFKRHKSLIQLTILPDMKIKCPHNYLYVYDGLPKFISAHHQEKILGSYCGINISKPLVAVAASGFMTIYFKRTDPSHGFNATYCRLECPHFCNVPNRICHDGRCQCKHNFAGPTCSKEICPNKCSSHLRHGECQLMYGKCLCYEGYGGKDCSIPTNDTHLLWIKLFDPDTVQPSQYRLAEELPRAGHSLLASSCQRSSSGCLWVFGGYSLTHGNKNDMYKFEITHNTWEKVETSAGPPPERRFHCATMVAEDIYIYGGLGNNEVLGDFWKFSTSQKVWTKLTTMKELPPLVASSLTSVERKMLILIGGFSYNYGFFEKVVKYDLADGGWEVLNSTGAVPVGIYGHTASYHQPTESLYVFGGVIYNADHATVSNGLYVLHYPSGIWSRLPSTNPSSVQPLPSALHAAAITDNYIVIIGGRGGKENDVIGKMYAYIFKCNIWLSLDIEKVPSVVGSPISSVAGISAVWWSGHTYVFGGFNGQVNGELRRLTLPSDLCNLFAKKRSSDCIQHTGCSHCAVYENGLNQTFCYSQPGIIPPSCASPKGSADITGGTLCTSEWIERRKCDQYTNCIDCIAFWPFHQDAKQVCQWCSNCQDGQCVPAGTSCKEKEQNVCAKPVVDPSSCPSRVCLASDCYKCSSLQGCIWTRQAERSSERSEELNAKPIFDWTCVRKMMKDRSAFTVDSMPPLTCPPRCSQHRNCSTCLDSAGGEGGWHECRWSEKLQQCMSPSFELLQCEGGSCWAMLQGSSSSCPVPCSHNTQAAHCLSYPHCGWCAFIGRKVDGRGLCMEGGILKPTAGTCHKKEVKLTTHSPPEISRWLKNSEGASWSYLERPPENECLNNHHNCNEEHEECVDKEDGFECKCKTGYSLVGKQCKPNCTQGCFHGTCVKPDMCKCNFGYVGHNCSIQCECNGHSNCKGPMHLNTCLECHNNTQGPQCQQCKPLFVGNPSNGGKCIPCREYCNGHSDICLGELPANVSLGSLQELQKYLETVKEGPTDGAICHNCQNNTEGNRCEQCVQGFFKEGESIKDGCRPCECHGHGDMCNAMNGENCNCQNNTESDRQCSNKNSKNMVTPCWKLQCSKCKEYFFGSPTHGHQCYRHMFMDKDYCFDPNTQEECNRKPSPLLQGRTVFFAVQPRYMNVDIRIIVDITKGGADFYLSAREDTFVVDVNKSTGIHYVSVDRRYGIDLNSDTQLYQVPLVVKDKKLSKREIKLEDIAGDSTNSNDSYQSSPLKLHEAWGRGLTTYITITDPQEFLYVRRLQNRLVISVPQHVHDLISTRFFMILHGVGSKSSNETYGSLFFRQDQTRIDLFVFFSVFFSCFFLFLAICVVIWKVKQAFDVRRARLLHAAEMKHMASRPFSSIVMLVEDEPDEYDFYPYSPSNFRKKHKYKGHLGRDSPKVYSDERCGTRPIAIEPISDGIAALVTVLIQLPGGMSAPVRLSLASALITVRGLSSHGNIGIRAPRRRRTSHVTL